VTLEGARELTYATARRFAAGEYPMREYGIERLWRDARLVRVGAGTDEIMRDVIGRSLGS
jgi:alkylation response protein AidB-like acyl-CoA dehydrogenase